jgi:hypothetical protein
VGEMMRVVMRGYNRWKREINGRKRTDRDNHSESDEREWGFMRERMRMKERIRERL